MFFHDGLMGIVGEWKRCRVGEATAAGGGAICRSARKLTESSGDAGELLRNHTWTGRNGSMAAKTALPCRRRSDDGRDPPSFIITESSHGLPLLPCLCNNYPNRPSLTQHSSSVAHPSFRFGGKSGSTVCTVAFRKTS